MPTVDAREAMNAMPVGTIFIPTEELNRYDTGGAFSMYVKIDIPGKVRGVWWDRPADAVHLAEGLSLGLNFNISGFASAFKFTIIRYGMEGEIYAPAIS